MVNLNNLSIMGRITQDVSTENKNFAKVGALNTPYATIPIAVNYFKKDKEEVSFFDVHLWGDRAEKLQPYLTKGKLIAVEGFLIQDRWEDDNGFKKSKVYIMANKLYLCDSKKDASNNNNSEADPF